MGPREPLRAITNEPKTCAVPNKVCVGSLNSERENRSDSFRNKADKPGCEAHSRNSYGQHHSSQRDQRIDQMPEKACNLDSCYAANVPADGDDVGHGSASTIDYEAINTVRWTISVLQMRKGVNPSLEKSYL